MFRWQGVLLFFCKVFCTMNAISLAGFVPLSFSSGTLGRRNYQTFLRQSFFSFYHSCSMLVSRTVSLSTFLRYSFFTSSNEPPDRTVSHFSKYTEKYLRRKNWPQLTIAYRRLRYIVTLWRNMEDSLRTSHPKPKVNQNASKFACSLTNILAAFHVHIASADDLLTCKPPTGA